MTTKYNDIDLSEITFSDIEYGDKFIYPQFDSHSILFETDTLFCPDPILIHKTKYTSHELFVSLSDPKMRDFFIDLDDILIKYGKINKSKMTNGNLNYKSIVRYDENDNEMINLKFIKSKTFNTMVFDKNKNLVKPDNYEKVFCGNIYVKMILEFVSIWIKDNTYGCYLRLHQIKTVDTQNKIYSFNDSSEEYICDTEQFNNKASEFDYVCSDSDE